MIRMTRTVSHAGRTYSSGDVVDDHDVAGMFVRLGMAEPDPIDPDPASASSDDAPGITDPPAVTKPRRPRRAHT